MALVVIWIMATMFLAWIPFRNAVRRGEGGNMGVHVRRSNTIPIASRPSRNSFEGEDVTDENLPRLSRDFKTIYRSFPRPSATAVQVTTDTTAEITPQDSTSTLIPATSDARPRTSTDAKHAYPPQPLPPTSTTTPATLPRLSTSSSQQRPPASNPTSPTDATQQQPTALGIPLTTFVSTLQKSFMPPKEEEEEEELCSICLENLPDVESRRCGHSFHRECISMWLHNGHVSCPVCRGELRMTVGGAQRAEGAEGRQEGEGGLREVVVDRVV
ncbi:hypothetical protein HDV05_005567 [Chytridiales sp. JEL 0842]|nr:hypothetical protein HDV05_005567 [Chytridiales sp. JEL 0842]